jgi:long-chain fatty acid transport protein
MEMRVHRFTRLFLASAALAAPAAVHAQAFGLNEIGSCAVARGFANTASPCKDASTIFWNPGAATRLDGFDITAGVASIAVNGGFTQDTTFRRFEAEVPTTWVPHVFVNYHAPASRVAFGVGMYVPYGLTSQWGSNFPGRFEATKASLATIYVQPNIALRIADGWSIGGGPVYGHSSVELIQGLDLSEFPAVGTTTFAQLGIATGTEFAQARLKGSADAWGAQFGISGRLGPNWSIGARYLTALKFKYDDADATFTPVPTNLTIGGTLPGPTPQTTIPGGTPVDALLASQFTSGALVSQKVSTHITHPAQFQGGLAYSGFSNLLLEADYAWVGWKSFDVLPVSFEGPAAPNSRTLVENYNNSSSVRLGAEYTDPISKWQLRAGYAGVQSAAPAETVTPLLPEQNRTYGTVGLGIPLFSRLTLDAAYAHISTPGRRGRIVERTTTQNATATAVQLNTGAYDLSANIFSFTLKAHF